MQRIFKCSVVMQWFFLGDNASKDTCNHPTVLHACFLWRWWFHTCTKECMLSQQELHFACAMLLQLPPLPCPSPCRRYCCCCCCCCQVVTLQSLLDQERAQAAELSQQLQALRRRYKALSKLRQLDNRRALMEGATFQAHTSPQPGGRLRLVSVHVCYVEAERALRFVEETAGPAPGGGSAGGRDAASCSVPIASLAKACAVVKGACA